MRVLFLILITASLTVSQALGAESSTNIQKEKFDVDDKEFENAFDEAEFDNSDIGLGVNLGQRTFTGGVGQIVDDSLSLGISALYEFNFNYAIEASYSRSDHNLSQLAFSDIGYLIFSSYALKGRYYPQFSSVPYNIVPYITAGISHNSMLMSYNSTDLRAKEYSTGYELGLGSKLLFLSDRAFFDLQVSYKQLAFNGREILDQNLNSTGVFFQGNEISLMSAITFIL